MYCGVDFYENKGTSFKWGVLENYHIQTQNLLFFPLFAILCTLAMTELILFANV